jgi:hypothetical protein
MRVAPAPHPCLGSFREKNKLDLTPETNSDLKLRTHKALLLDGDHSVRTPVRRSQSHRAKLLMDKYFTRNCRFFKDLAVSTG